MRFIVVILLFILASCVSDSTSTNTNSEDGNPTDVQITGVVSAGPVDGATVSLYRVNADGTDGALIANTTSDSAGNFSFTLAPETGPVEIYALNGTFNEEASGLPITLNVALRTRLAALPAGKISVGVTPLTEIASTCASTIQAYTGATQAVNISNCNKALSLASGLTDITKAPANPNLTLSDPTSQAAKYSLLLAGISEFANQNNFDSSLVVLDALKADFYFDGKFDGKNNGTPLTFSDIASTPMHSYMWSNELVFSISYYRNSSSIFSSASVPLLTSNPSLTCSSEAPTKCGALCVVLSSSPYNCGTCGNACPAVSNANPTCVSSVCGFECITGYTNCAGSCLNLQSDVNNCGACGQVCANRANSSPSCASGLCGVNCSYGYANCNGSAGDGCEVNTSSDIYNCGACGMACSSSPHSSPTCSLGTCGFTCSAGYGNCDMNPGNGCETYTNADNNNCGSCGTVCTMGKSCVNGSCQ
jgi:hypothetical protein